MRAIPVDAKRLTIIVVGEAKPQLKNKDTGEVAFDEETKSRVMNLDVTVIVEGRAETVQLSLPEVGMPKEGFPVGSTVTAEDMLAITWKKEGRSGVMVRARALRPATAAPVKAA